MTKEVKNILMHLPAAWDDTKLLSGYPGTEVVLARRIGNKWYIAGINGTKEKRVLSFNTERIKLNYKTSCTIVKDGKDDKSFDISPNSIETNEVINIPCLPMGGFLIVTE